MKKNKKKSAADKTIIKPITAEPTIFWAFLILPSVKKVEKKEQSKKVEEHDKLVPYDDELYTEEELRNKIMEDAFGGG